MSGQPLSLPLLGESRTTTAARSTNNVGACPVVPPTHAVTNKVNLLLILSRVCSEELDFRTTGHLTATIKDQTHDGIRLSCRSDTIPARAPLGHPTPYLQGHQSVQVPTKQVKPGGITLDGTHEVVR